jgi:hypothetical protein
MLSSKWKEALCQKLGMGASRPRCRVPKGNSRWTTVFIHSVRQSRSEIWTLAIWVLRSVALLDRVASASSSYCLLHTFAAYNPRQS